jgi:hypothetical protein
MTTRRKSRRLTKVEDSDDDDAGGEDQEEKLEKPSSGKGRKRPSIHDSDDDDDNVKQEADESDKNGRASKSPAAKDSKGKLSVPKKVRKSEPRDADTKDPSQPSRLVKSAAAALSPSSQPVTGGSPPVAKSPAARKKQASASTTTATTTEAKSQSPKQQASGGGAGDGGGGGGGDGSTMPRPLAPQSSQTAVVPTKATSSSTATQSLTTKTMAKGESLWQKLETMCSSLTNNTESDRHFQLNNNNNNTSSSSVDLSGSFLRHDPYDFFDTDAATGEIVLEPRHAMFPEDFSRGMKEHPLSWWGVLDPVHGKGKFRPVQLQTAQPPALPLHAQQQQQLQQQQQQLHGQQQQQQPWPTHGRDRGGGRGPVQENGGMPVPRLRQDGAGPPGRWNALPLMEERPWMGQNGGGGGGPRNGGGGPGMMPNGGGGGRGGGGVGGGGGGPGRGRPYPQPVRPHGRR